nr:responsive to dehydration 22a [Dianthus spiculifolius]
MELHLIPIIMLLYVTIMSSHAALTPEHYWKEALPNVVMPKSIRDSLPDPEWMDSKATNVNVQKGGVHISTDGAKKGNTDVSVAPKGGVAVSTGKPEGGHTHVSVAPKGGVRVSTQKPNKGGATVGVGKGGVVVHAGPKKKPVYVGVHKGPNPFQYNYAASEAQLHDDPTKALFFLEKDMKTGHKMTIHFTQTTNGATFMPRDEAESLPFSTDKMSEILREFSVQPGSEEAQTIQETVKECQSKGIQGEQKYCATSLESMVDYSKSTLGKNVKAISTEAKNGGANGLKYTIGAVRRVTRDSDSSVVCHKQNYAYAVFYCHKTKGTSPYVVSLFGEDGTKAKAVAVCHKDTSGWNPKHLAFQVLNVKPGGVPICHFLPEDHVVWVRN